MDPNEIYPNGIDGFADEQERCEAAEEAAYRLQAERDELRAKLAVLARTMTHYDETAPKKERYRVLREGQNDRWHTVKSFPTEREAVAFERGYALGARHVGCTNPPWSR